MAENRVEANAHNAGGCPASNAIHGHINDFLVRTGLRSGVSELQLPCFTAVRAEIALMSGGAFAVTHHPVSSWTGGTADRNRSHWSTSKTPSYTKSVSWQHHPICWQTKIMNPLWFLTERGMYWQTVWNHSLWFFRSRENKRNVHHQIMYDEFSTVYSNYLANNQTGVTRPTENTGKVITRWQRKSGFFWCQP